MRSAFVVLALTLAACAGRGRPDEPAPAEPVTVVMVNRNWATVNVYAVRDGSWSRLGTVSTNEQARARLPRWATVGGAKVQLKVQPIGARDSYITDPILVAAGQQITLYVQPALGLTNWAVQ